MSFFEFASSWLLGFFTHVLTNDQAAISQCRQLMLNFKRQLEKLKASYSNSNRPANFAYEMLMQIKITLENLEVACTGLLGNYKELSTLINESLDYMRRCEPYCDNFADSPNAIAIDLLQLWGILETNNFKISSLYKIQNFLNRSFLVRFLALRLSILPLIPLFICIIIVWHTDYLRSGTTILIRCGKLIGIAFMLEKI